MVAALDLPDPTAWAEFCQQNDLPVPPPLQVDRATQLNEAYGQGDGLDQLLRVHRRLALCHAPIKDRLQAMRAIADADPSSTFWDKDIRTFELARMKELKCEFAVAIRDQDAETVARLSVEVLQSAWREPLSSSLQSMASNAHERIRLSIVNTKLKVLVGRLRDAFAAKDHPACSAVLDEIAKLLGGGGAAQTGVSPEVAAEIRPVMAWVNQEKELARKRTAIAEAQRRLAEALDGDVDDVELESLYERLKQFDEPVSEDLDRRYHERLQDRHHAIQRKYRLMLVTVAAMALLVLVGGYLYFRSGLAGGWAQRIQHANESRNLTLAHKLIEEQQHRAGIQRRSRTYRRQKRHADSSAAVRSRPSNACPAAGGFAERSAVA